MDDQQQDGHSADLPDEELMLRVGRGDGGAFDVLVRRHAAAAVAFLTRMSGDRHLAEDLAQEAFVRVYRARERYRPTAKFRTYLFTVARNLFLDEVKKRGRRPDETSLDRSVSTGAGPGSTLGSLLEQDADERVPTPEGLPDDHTDAIARALDLLDEKYRSVVVLSVYEDMKYRDIAQVLDISEGTVASRKNTAMRRLRETLERLDSEAADAMRRGR